MRAKLMYTFALLEVNLQWNSSPCGIFLIGDCFPISAWSVQGYGQLHFANGFYTRHQKFTSMSDAITVK